MKVELVNAMMNKDHSHEFLNTLKIRHLDIQDEVMLNDFMNVPVHAISSFLKMKKSTSNEGTGLVVRNEQGGFLCAGKVAYHKPEQDSEIAGNWSYEFVTTEDDIKGLRNYDIFDTEFLAVFKEVLYTDYGLELDMDKDCVALMAAFFEALFNVLEANANEAEPFQIISDGYFIAESQIKGDTKYYSIIPDGKMKQIVKGDAVLETAVAE